MNIDVGFIAAAMPEVLRSLSCSLQLTSPPFGQLLCPSPSFIHPLFIRSIPPCSQFALVYSKSNNILFTSSLNHFIFKSQNLQTKSSSNCLIFKSPNLQIASSSNHQISKLAFNKLTKFHSTHSSLLHFSRVQSTRCPYCCARRACHRLRSGAAL
jgi:hypothetical protein